MGKWSQEVRAWVRLMEGDGKIIKHFLCTFREIATLPEFSG